MNRSTPALDSSQAFLRRFDNFALDYRRRRVLRCICWTIAAALAVFVAITAADYLFELDYRLRASAAVLLLGAAALATLVGAVRTTRRATDQAIAAEMENRFPELGQAVRTAVQYRNSASSAGASPALLAAMQGDLETRTSVLPIEQALTRCRARRSAIALAGVAAAIILGVALSWQWRLAAQRILFGDEPYTRVAVSPGDAVVEEGAAMQIVATVAGRNRQAVLMTRPYGVARASWLARELSPIDEVRRTGRQIEYKVELPNLQQPVEYLVVAGQYASASHRISVRRQLEVQSIRIEVEPPEYTGTAPTVFDDGSFRGLAGSRARFQITLDRPAREASLALTRLGGGADESSSEAMRNVTLGVDGRTLTGELELTRDATYAITGRGVDGSRLRDNRYRIRVLHDQLPRIAFREPSMETETHALAEIAMTARVSDDFGLTKAGIVFRVNNGPEYPLVSFPKSQSSSEPAPAVQSRAALEAVLPLEALEVTQRDSISYFAFAEDNAPEGSRRVETELRFLDVRPFRRLYRAPQGAGGGGGRPQLASLEQLIRRERWLLNRSLRLARAVERDEQTNLDEVDDAISMQDDTAALTRELADAATEAEAVLGITEDRISDLFYAAEEAMMRAVDALSVGDFPRSHLQQVDAAASLVAARNAIEVLLGQGGGGAGLERLLRLDDELIQRMRGRRGDVQRMKEVARRLRALANREERVGLELQDLGKLDGADSVADDSKPSPAAFARADRRRELEEEQSDVSQEAEDVDEMVQELESVTELIRTRARAGVEAATAVSTALDRIEIAEAASAARRASLGFRQLAQHVEGVTPTEPAGRLAVARDVASFVALELRDLGADLTNRANAPPDSSAASPETSASQSSASGGLAAETAGDLAESAATVRDILESIVATFAIQQDEVILRLRQLVAESDVDQNAALLEQIEASILAERWPEAGLESEAVADRMDQLSQRLEALYASLVAPRIAQLRALEQRAMELQSQLTRLSSEAQVRRWRQRLSGLIDDLESANVKLFATPELRKIAEMNPSDGGKADEGWSPSSNGILQPPKSHTAAVDAMVREIQRYLHELAFGRVDADNADMAPPQYVELVRRYLELLSAGAGD